MTIETEEGTGLGFQEAYDGTEGNNGLYGNGVGTASTPEVAAAANNDDPWHLGRLESFAMTGGFARREPLPEGTTFTAHVAGEIHKHVLEYGTGDKIELEPGYDSVEELIGRA